MKRPSVIEMCATLMVFVALSIPSEAHGQASAAAEELYRRGVENFRAGRYEIACQELRESYRMEELPGVLFTLATCEARAGQVASAAAHYGDFLDYVAQLPAPQRLVQKDRERVAREERTALLPQIPYVVLRLSAELPRDARLTLDGAELGERAVGRRLPLDPGRHTVVVTRGGDAREERSFTIAAREVLELELTVPERRAALPVPRAAAEPRDDPLLPWKIVSGSIGGVGLATGAVAGILAIERKSVVDEHCEGAACDATGKSAADTARTAALVSTIGFGVGLGGLATLLILQFVDPDDGEEPAPAQGLVFTGDGVAWRGVF